MTTLVRTWLDGDASQKNIGFIDPEPLWDLPTSGLVGAFRFGRSIELSKTNRVQGGWGDMTPNNAPVVDRDGVTMSSAGFFSFASRVPSAPLTIVSVFQRPSPSVNHLLGGYRSTAVPTNYLGSASSGADFAYSRGASTSGQATVSGGTARADMAAGRFDVVNGVIKADRPRTGVKVETAFSDWATPTNTYRIGTDAGAVKHYAHIIYNRAITDTELAQVYETVRDSLATSGIEI